MEEVRYESGLGPLPGFQPKKRAKFDKQRQAFAAQAERNQRQQSDTIRENIAVDAANARQSERDIEALAQFSTSLTEQLIEGQKKRNEEEKQKGRGRKGKVGSTRSGTPSCRRGAASCT